jgi:hypothetical protein
MLNNDPRDHSWIDGTFKRGAAVGKIQLKAITVVTSK